MYTAIYWNPLAKIDFNTVYLSSLIVYRIFAGISSFFPLERKSLSALVLHVNSHSYLFLISHFLRPCFFANLLVSSLFSLLLSCLIACFLNMLQGFLLNGHSTSNSSGPSGYCWIFFTLKSLHPYRCTKRRGISIVQAVRLPVRDLQTSNDCKWTVYCFLRLSMFRTYMMVFFMWIIYFKYIHG